MCTKGGIRFGEFEERKEENIFKISDNLLVKTNFKWDREGSEIPVKRRMPAKES